MAVIGYARVNTGDQTTETQRHSLQGTYNIDKWFADEAVSGITKGRDRTGLGALLSYVRDGDKVVVYSIDSLGRDTIDVLTTVEDLQAKGIAIISMREGFDLSTDHGKLMLTMLGSPAELESKIIKARQIDDAKVVQWRTENLASIKQTAEHFGISSASVKRAFSAQN